MDNSPSSAELSAAYARDGFVVVRALWSADECAVLKAEALRVVAELGRPNSSVFVGAAASSPYLRATPPTRGWSRFCAR